jgi:hypothetical protein
VVYENFPSTETGVYGANRIFLVVNVHYVPDLGPTLDTFLLDVSGYFSGDLSQSSGWSVNGSINIAWNRVNVFGVAEYWNPSGVGKRVLLLAIVCVCLTCSLLCRWISMFVSRFGQNRQLQHTSELPLSVVQPSIRSFGVR